jgi:PAS domain S-box-containing protein
MDSSGKDDPAIDAFAGGSRARISSALGPSTGKPERAASSQSAPNLVVETVGYLTVANQTTDGILLADGKTHRIVDINASALQLLGYKRHELIGALLTQLIPVAALDIQRSRIAAAPNEPSLISRASYRRKDGSLIEVEIEQRQLEDGRILGVLRSLSQSEPGKGPLSQMLTRFDLFVITLDREGRISYANPALSALTGWSNEELIGRSAHDLLPVGPTPEPGHPLSDEFLVGDLEYPISAEILTRAAKRRLVSVSATLLRNGAGAILGAAVFGQVMTQERVAHTELERKLRELGDVAAAIARVHPGGTMAATAQALCRELKGLGGVELSAVMVFGADGVATVLAMDTALPLPFSPGLRIPPGRSGYLLERATLGPWVEIYRERVQDGEFGRELARAGIQGCSYAPIRHGRNTLGLLIVGCFRHNGAEVTVENLPAIAEFGAAASALLYLDLQADRIVQERRDALQHVIDERTFHPVFQPIVDVNTGLVKGYEALTRFADGEPPEGHFSAAWSVGLGLELELATLERAIRVGQGLPDGPWLNVNLSPRLLTRPRELRELLQGANQPLVVEITEHDVITDYSAVRDALQQLGPIRVAVDDAGAGIANFAHIVDLRPDFVKVDIGLVRGVDTDLARQAMIVALCHFARATNCQLIAEGVETRREANTLKSLGVSFAQGYWYGRPVSLGTIVAAERKKVVGFPAHRTWDKKAR